MEKDLGLAIDLGATRLRVCLGDRRGKILWRESRFMAIPESVDDYVKQVVDEAREGMKRADPARVSGVGIASVGPLDLKKGGMASPANVPYGFVPLVEPLRKATGKEVVLMNDANAAALGERNFGAGRGHENLVYVTISTGIGGGAIVDGHLLVGKDGNAAEIGHLVVDPAGRLMCGCGRLGHWEAYCSGKGIPRLAMLLAGAEAREGAEARLEKMLGLGRGPVDSASVLGAAARGNKFGARVAEEMGRLNSLGMADVVDMFDPSLITIGGGVALNNQELVLGPIRQLVPKNAINRVPEIVITPLGDDAGLIGALSLAFGI